MAKVAVIAVALMAVAGAAGAGYWYHVSLSPTAKAKEQVLLTLFDPESARFRAVKQSTERSDVVCGEVNAKNRMGGMVGFRRFIVRTGDDPAVVIEDDSEPIGSDPQKRIAHLEAQLKFLETVQQLCALD